MPKPLTTIRPVALSTIPWGWVVTLHASAFLAFRSFAVVTSAVTFTSFALCLLAYRNRSIIIVVMVEDTEKLHLSMTKILLLAIGHGLNGGS